jgi:hypothetical protein
MKIKVSKKTTLETFYKHELYIPWVERTYCYECSGGWRLGRKLLFRWGKYTKRVRPDPLLEALSETLKLYQWEINKQMFGDFKGINTPVRVKWYKRLLKGKK